MTAAPMSPCATCATMSDCSACGDFDRWLEATEPPPEPTCPTCEDVEFLLLAGESFDFIAGKLKVKRTSLERHLFRHRRPDLIRREVKW